MSQPKPKTGQIKNRKISPVDVVIALIFVIALGAIIYLTVTLFSDGSRSKEKGIAADCRLKIENVETERFGITLNEVTGGVECAFLKTGDKVYDPISGEEIGQITALSYEIATASSGDVDEDGNLVYVAYPGYVNIILTVRTTVAGENDRRAGSLSLRIGESIHLRTASYEADALVSDVETGVN